MDAVHEIREKYPSSPSNDIVNVRSTHRRQGNGGHQRVDSGFSTLTPSTLSPLSAVSLNSSNFFDDNPKNDAVIKGAELVRSRILSGAFDNNSHPLVSTDVSSRSSCSKSNPVSLSSSSTNSNGFEVNLFEFRGRQSHLADRVHVSMVEEQLRQQEHVNSLTRSKMQQKYSKNSRGHVRHRSREFMEPIIAAMPLYNEEEEDAEAKRSHRKPSRFSRFKSMKSKVVTHFRKDECRHEESEDKILQQDAEPRENPPTEKNINHTKKSSQNFDHSNTVIPKAYQRNDEPKQPHLVNADTEILSRFQIHDTNVLDEFTSSRSHISLHRMALSERTPPLPKLSKESKSKVLDKQVDIFIALQKDKAYCHASRAGLLWQSLVGEFVRFPSTWYQGDRTPAMNSTDLQATWKYISRDRIEGNSKLNSLVPNSRSKGRILLHIIVQDLLTLESSQDITVGCFHPNSKGVWGKGEFDAVTPRSKGGPCGNKDMRELWMAVRHQQSDGSIQQTLSLIDPWIKKKHPLQRQEVEWDSPVGKKRNVGNTSIHSLFGDESPLNTLFISEGDLYEKMQKFQKDPSTMRSSPALLLLRVFCFKQWS